MGQTFSTIQYYAALSALFAVGSVVSLALFLAIVTQLKALREQGMLDPSLPFVGRQKELFAAIRANVRGMTESASLYIDAYRTVSSLLFGFVSISLTHVTYSTLSRTRFRLCRLGPRVLRSCSHHQ
jgi:hypothetical protein